MTCSTDIAEADGTYVHEALVGEVQQPLRDRVLIATVSSSERRRTATLSKPRRAHEH